MPMIEDDLKAVYAIETRVFPHPWSINYFRLIIADKNNYMVTLKVGDQVVGYGGYHLLTQNVVFPVVKRNYDRIIHLINIAIDLSYQHKGYGSFLLSRLLHTAYEKDAEYTYLEVRPSNAHALKLYRKFGFALIGIIEKYYPQEDENAFVMGKEL